MEENSSFEYEKKNGYVVITALRHLSQWKYQVCWMDSLSRIKRVPCLRKVLNFVPSGYCKKDWKIWIL